MWNTIILVILFIITGCSIYYIDKLFVNVNKNVNENVNVNVNENENNYKNLETGPDGYINSIDISTNYILIISMENCPFCVKLQEDYISKTSKKYAIVTYKKDGTFGFDNNFLEIHQEERTDIINGLDKFLKGHVVFPTIIHDKKIIRGLKDKDLLNNIFNITE